MSRYAANGKIFFKYQQRKTKEKTFDLLLTNMSFGFYLGFLLVDIFFLTAWIMGTASQIHEIEFKYQQRKTREKTFDLLLTNMSFGFYLGFFIG